MQKIPGDFRVLFLFARLLAGNGAQTAPVAAFTKFGTFAIVLLLLAQNRPDLLWVQAMLLTGRLHPK